MSGTLSGNYTNGITLSSNPTTITGTVANQEAAVYGAAGTDWSLANQGLITSSKYYGIAIIGTGAVSNSVAASIIGYFGGIVNFRDINVTNAGTIAATFTDGFGVLGYEAGEVTNQSGGHISGDVGVELPALATVLNAGTISGSIEGVVTGGGLVYNQAGGLITGADAVELEGAGTVINAGTIAGVSGGFAVEFNNFSNGTAGSVLLLEQGSTLIGAVGGIVAGDTLDFAGITASSASFAGGVLSLYGGSTELASIALSGQFNSSEFTVSSDGAGGTDVTLGVEIVTGTYGAFQLSAETTSFTATANVAGAYSGVSGESDQYWTVQNAGTIRATNASFGYGLSLDRGTFTNLAGGVILGGSTGLRIGGGSVDNFGTIGGTGATASNAIQLQSTSYDIGIRLETSSVLFGAISGLEAGDRIELAGVTATSAIFATNVLSLMNDGTLAATLSLAGNFNTPEFVITPDATGGTDISLGPAETFSGSYGGVSLSALYTSITAGTQIFSTSPYAGVYGLGIRDWTLINAGTVGAASYSSGIVLRVADFINQAGATVSGYSGLAISGGTVLNEGTILGTGRYGVTEESAERATAPPPSAVEALGIPGLYPLTIVNAANGFISGTIGVQLQGAQGTLTNAGTIASSLGEAGQAVSFRNGNDRLVIDPGAVFIGSIVSADTLTGFEAHLYQTTFDNVLEFASGKGGGDFGGIGETVTGFNDIILDEGGAWSLSGDVAGLASGQSITGFISADTLHLDGFTFTADRFVSGQGLVLQDAGGSVALDLIGSFSTGDFNVFNDATGTEIEMALCFLRGTRIATPAGERAVEALAPGDAVLTRDGGVQALKWIGRQSYAPQFIAGNPDKHPVRIRAGALGAGVPARDLLLSPGHALLLDDVLVLADQLVNGITIVQEPPTDTVDYYAIELAAHDCVLADGTWAETYADGPGLRNQFHNRAEFFTHFPDYAPPEEIRLCRPRPVHGAALEHALAPVLARAAAWRAAGELRGSIDLIEPDGLIEGWAQDLASPALAVPLYILRGGEIIGTACACEYRADLAQARIGRGWQKFSFTVPGGLTSAARGAITVRRAADGVMLPVSDDCQRRLTG